MLWGKAHARTGAAPAVALVRGPAIIKRHDLVFAGTLSAGEIAAAYAALREVGILVRRPRAPFDLIPDREAFPGHHGHLQRRRLQHHRSHLRARDHPLKARAAVGLQPRQPRSVRARVAVALSRDSTLSLIPISELGSAYEQQIPERREIRAFVCRQFKKQHML